MNDRKEKQHTWVHLERGAVGYLSLLSWCQFGVVSFHTVSVVGEETGGRPMMGFGLKQASSSFSFLSFFFLFPLDF